MKQLGEKDFWYYIQLVLITPLWALWPNRKPWDQFKNGLIKHDCEFEQVPYEIDKSKYWSVHWFKCKHYGCNIVHCKNYPTQQEIDLWKGTEWDIEKSLDKPECFYAGIKEPIFKNIPIKYS